MKAVLSVVVGMIWVAPMASKAADVSSPLDSLSATNVEQLRFSAVSLSDLQEYAPADRTDWVDSSQFAFAPLPRPKTAAAAPARRMALVTRDSSKEMAEQSFPVKSRYHVSGEVGAAYGVSTGKDGAESEAGYIVGGVGNDKVQITAGASYENTTFRVPRSGR